MDECDGISNISLEEQFSLYWNFDSYFDSLMSCMAAKQIKADDKEEIIIKSIIRNTRNDLENIWGKEFFCFSKSLHRVFFKYKRKTSQLVIHMGQEFRLSANVLELFNCVMMWWYFEKIPSIVDLIIQEGSIREVDENLLIQMRNTTWPDALSKYCPYENKKKLINKITKECEKCIYQYGITSSGFFANAQKALTFISHVLGLVLSHEAAGINLRTIVYNTVENPTIWNYQLSNYISINTAGYYNHYLIMKSRLDHSTLIKNWKKTYRSICEKISSGEYMDYIAVFICFTIEYACDCMDVSHFFTIYTTENPSFLKQIINYAISNYKPTCMIIENGIQFNQFLKASGCLIRFLDGFLEKFLLREVISNEHTFTSICNDNNNDCNALKSTNALPISIWFDKNDRFNEFINDIKMSLRLQNFQRGKNDIITLKTFNKSIFPNLCRDKLQNFMEIPSYFELEFNSYVNSINADELQNKCLHFQPHLQRFIIKCPFSSSCLLDVDIWQAIVLMELYSIKNSWEWNEMITKLKVTNKQAFKSILMSFRKHKILLKKNTSYKININFETGTVPFMVSYSSKSLS